MRVHPCNVSYDVRVAFEATRAGCRKLVCNHRRAEDTKARHLGAAVVWCRTGPGGAGRCKMLHPLLQAERTELA